jgi:hypothetical protein
VPARAGWTRSHRSGIDDSLCYCGEYTSLEWSPPLSFRQLNRLSLKEYIEEQKDDENLWLFLHIPKTAGSSFGTELSVMRPPYRNIHVDYRNQRERFGDQLQRAIDAFIADAKRIRFRSASGHLQIYHALQIADAVPRCKFVTFVRDPVARVVSDYRYQRTPDHPPFQEFIEKFPTLQSYVTTAAAQDKMFSHLSGDRALEFEAGYRSIQDNFVFVGLVEHYPMCFNVFSRFMGTDAMPTRCVRRTQANAANRVELGPEAIRQIRRLNPRDCRLFNRVKKVWSSLAGEWTEMRTHSPAAAALDEEPGQVAPSSDGAANEGSGAHRRTRQL